METQTLNSISLISATTTSSSWPVVRGSLDHSVTCDSSLSAVDSDSDDHDHDHHHHRKPPIVLRRPSPDSAPCEITIGFAQKHEIKQVYVRSSARVYEIHYATNDKDGNDYLCTVRCGFAATTEDLLKETDAVGPVDTTSGADEGHSRSISESSTSEDGWVDVKLPDSSPLGPAHTHLSKERTQQALFEATAEISDADPVLSVTLRLLSIQSGDYVYVDEVYVFADPVVSDDVDSSPKMPENSSGNALMSMLIPTFLQLSKSRMSQMQERLDSDAGERRHQDAESKYTGAAITSNALHSDKKRQQDAAPINALHSERMQSTRHNGASPPMSKPDVPVQTQDTESIPYSTSRETSCNVERSLDELVSRIARIEQFCLRFEENMLKPIGSMQARLGRVEQQLESLIKNSESYKTANNRFSAPEFPCNESVINYVRTGGNDDPGVKSETSNEDDCRREELSNLSSDASSCADVVRSSDAPSSNSVSQLLPSLVVTAPDFSNVDDEEEDDAAEAVNCSPNDSLKKPLSINDALASALAGFISSTSSNPLNCADEVDGGADFPSVKGSENTSLTALVLSDEPVFSSIRIGGGNETASASCSDFVVTEQEYLDVDNGCEERIKAVDEHDRDFGEEGNDEPPALSVDSVINLVKNDLGDGDRSAEVGYGEADENLKQTFVSHHCEAPTLVDSTSSINISVAASEVTAGKVDVLSEKNVAKMDPDLLESILKLPSPTVVDFRIPILDVKFSSLENYAAKSPVEALFIEGPKNNSEVLDAKEQNESSFGEQNDLVMVENTESASSETCNSQLFCLDAGDYGYMPPNAEEEKLQDLHICSNQDMYASLI